ncbi:MAG: ATP-binding protein [Negativicutes bacterium]|nr:ATP-binding protein [Negativicutes bacterium]
MFAFTCQPDIEFLCEAIPAALIAIDKSYHIVLVNKGAEVLFDTGRDMLLGQDLRLFLAADRANSFVIEKALTVEKILPAQKQVLVCNGRSVQALFEAAPLFGSDHQLSGALILIKDLGHLRETEKRMHHLEILSSIGEMAAGAIHEIRNPLTSINGFVQLLQLRAAKHSDQLAVDYCNLITDEILHINSILSDFLKLAKPHETKTAKIDIVPLVRDVLALLYGEALLFQMTILHHLPDAPLYLEGNAEKIKEVLINICRNAFQAMLPGGTLTITVTVDSENIRVALSDTGHGMTDATIANIFKPFFTTKESGTGLGLALCQRIMRDHGGQISVSSKLDQGSTFTLVFPRFAEKAE